MPLTDTTVRNTKPTNKTLKMFDGGGLYLEVSPNGGKWWRLKYRYLGKEKRISLGVYPDVSLKMARDRRGDARTLLADGIDPSQHRKTQKQDKKEMAANTFEVLAREWHDKQSTAWTDKYATDVMRVLESNVFPWIGGEPVATINPKEVLATLRRIEERGKLHTAHRTLSVCSQVFRYAVATGIAIADPCRDLKGTLPPEKVKHQAAITDPVKVGGLLRAIDTYEGSVVVRCALRLAPLVFVRPGELRRAEWKDIDLEKAEWRFTVTKTNTPHIVPLARQAIAVFKEIKPVTGTGQYVFPSGRSTKRPMSDNAVLGAMRRMGIEKNEMTGHGFRATARTILDEVLGFRPDFIEHQLAHSVRDPNGRAYNRTAHLKDRKKMMQDWANYLDNLKTGASILETVNKSV
jgi:integrase